MKFAPLFARILLSFIAASSLVIPVRVDAAPRKGQPAPSFTVTSTTGQSISLNNYRDHVLILDFFATWCQPCRESIPHLAEMNRKYGKQGLQILGLSVDEDGGRMVKAFSDELRINYPVTVTGDQVTVDFGVRSVPIMFLINKKGEIVEIYRGYTTDMGRSLDQAIRRLLAEK